MNLLSIDLEFNNKKEILSSGLISSKFFQIKHLEEKFFNNKSDDKTYMIHGLNSDFLSKYGDKENNIKELIKQHDLIIGFDLKNDLKVLHLNAWKMYSSNKIIDIKLILSTFNINISLSNLLKKTNLLKDFKNLFPIHTSIMDSFLSFIFIEYLSIYILKHSNISLEELLIDLSKISNHKYFNEYWIYEPIVEKYHFLYSLFQEINNKEIIYDSLEPYFKLELNNNIEIYNKNFYIIGKYKKEENFDFEELKSVDIKTKPDLSIGYRDHN